MAKRKRPNKLIDKMSAQSVEETPAAEKAAESVEVSTDAILAPNKVTTEIAETLEQAEELKLANVQLFQEKSDLIDQLSTSINENDQLKAKIETLNNKIKELEELLSIEKAAKEEIQSQADNQLIKISNMSYELATLKTKISAMNSQNSLESSCEATIIPDPSSSQNAMSLSSDKVDYNKPKRYRRLLPRNGYSSWN